MQDEQIMCIALLKTRGLGSLSEVDLRSLNGLFHLQQRESHEERLLQLKKTLCCVILIERNDIQEYLRLSKFRRVRVEAYSQMVSYITELWELFSAQKQSLGKTNIKTFRNIKSPMQKLTKALSDTKVVDPKPNSPPQDYQQYNNNYFPRFNRNPQEPRMNYPSQPLHNYNMYPYQNYLGSSLFPDYNNRNGVFDQMVPQDKNQEDCLVNTHPKIKAQPPKREHFIKQIDQMTFKQQQLSQNQLESSLTIKPLRGCFCGQPADSTLIKCQQCTKQFHLQCWQSQLTMDAVCPFCRVTAHHAYSSLQGRPILERCSMTDQQFFWSKRILLSEEEMKGFNQSVRFVQSSSPDKTWIEVRIMKICKEETGPKGLKSCFTLPISELRKVQERKWLELKFKNVVLGDCLIFVLVCTRLKELPELKQQIQARGQRDNFVKEWLVSRGLQSYKLNTLHPRTKAPVSFPMRGPRCEHIECQDLSVIYQQGTRKEGKISCSFCYKEYSVYEPFNFDRKVFNALRKEHQHNEIQLNLAGLEEEKGVEVQEKKQSEEPAFP